MPSELERIIDQVGKDKGIDKEILVDALQAAMVSAAKKKLGHQRDIEAQYNPDVGEVELFEFKTVVEEVNNPVLEISLEDAKATDPEIEMGDSLGQKVSTASFGRIAAQTAKQVIMQKVREAERERVYNQYKDQKGELVHGTVQRFEKGDMIVSLGKAEAMLPFQEQIPRENYRIGDRIRAYTYDVDKNAKGPLIKLTRVRPEMLTKLFDLEVPEIYDGIVEVKGAVREPGGRAKIAVYSRDIDVDPVGACVGMKGSRVQAVVYELRGEKIDIVPFSNDIATYCCNALAPAEISKVIIDEREHSIEVIVPDNQLSLAIGKKGQNVRLASKLLNWKIEIRGETEAENSFLEAKSRLEALKGVGDVLARSLINVGIFSVADIDEWDAESLAQATQIGLKKIEALKELAREHLKAVSENKALMADEEKEKSTEDGSVDESAQIEEAAEQNSSDEAEEPEEKVTAQADENDPGDSSQPKAE